MGKIAILNKGFLNYMSLRDQPLNHYITTSYKENAKKKANRKSRFASEEAKV